MEKRVLRYLFTVILPVVPVVVVVFAFPVYDCDIRFVLCDKNKFGFGETDF